MRRVLRSFVAIAWAVFGCIGVGTIAGEVWLDGALRTQPTARPPVQFIAPDAQEHAEECPARVLPASMDALTAALRVERRTDLPAFAQSLMDCAPGPAERAQFIAMLHAAAHRGDTVAALALDTLALRPCADLTVIGGTPADRRAAVAEACRLALPRPDGSLAAAPDGIDVQTRTFRFAQLLALVAAGVAKPDAIAQFCADAPHIPSAANIRLAVAFPDFAALLQEHCTQDAVTTGAPAEVTPE